MLFEVTSTVLPDIALCVLSCGMLAFILPFRWPALLSNRYRVTTERLSVSRGVAARRVEEAELYRVKDVTVQQGSLGRILSFGDVVVRVNDASTPYIVLKNVQNPVGLKEQIRNAMRTARCHEGVRSVEHFSGG